MAQLAHALLGASSSERWLNCPGSVAASVGMPNEESVYARTGNCAHDVAELCLKEGKKALEFLGAEIRDYEDIEVDELMCAAVQDYLDFVAAVIQRYHDEGHDDEVFLVEHRFDLSHLDPDMFGTCDAVLYFPAWRKLMVIDYKNGWVAVGAENNTQIQYYALGAVYTKDNWDFEEVELVIVQPHTTQVQGVKTWKTSRTDLMVFKDRLLAGAEATRDPNAPFFAGKWCTYCPARPLCATLLNKCLELTMATIDIDGTVKPLPVERMPLDKLKLLWENAGILEGHAKGVKQYVHAQALAGNLLPGTKLVEGRSRRRWRDASTILGKLRAIVDLGYELGDILEHKLKSPAQLEAMLPKKERAVLKGLWEKGPSGLSLVSESDERKAAKVDGASEFEVLD